MQGKYWIVLASLLAALSVGLGAYHAHGFKKELDGLTSAGTISADEAKKRLDNCEVGVRYQMFNALALLAIGTVAMNRPSRLLNISGVLLVLGMCLFSGGLYLFAFTGNIGHFAIIPSGGLLQIIGWISLAVAALKLPEPAK